jgi:hydrogenase small subunit
LKVSRREFLKYCTMSAAALGLSSALGPLEKALANTDGPPILWLKGAGCTGCTVSLANLISGSAPVDLADLLINTIDLEYHPTLMGAAGDQATQILNNASAGTFVLVVEGAIPTLFNGITCEIYTHNGQPVTALSAVQSLAPLAAQVLSVGTCASFGGIAGAAPNPTEAMAVSDVTSVSPINIPGCPPHPDWIVWTVANLLAGNPVSLDSERRPTALYGSTVHDQCPREPTSWSPTTWANSLSDTGKCTNGLGCKGKMTHADCPTRKWNNGVNWCVGQVGPDGNGADSLCQGCTEPGFPDAFAPLFSTKGYDQYHDLMIDPPQRSCTGCHDE